MVSRHRVSITKLSASKAMFASVVALSRFAELEERITELEEKSHAGTRFAGCVA